MAGLVDLLVNLMEFVALESLDVLVNRAALIWDATVATMDLQSEVSTMDIEKLQTIMRGDPLLYFAVTEVTWVAVFLIVVHVILLEQEALLGPVLAVLTILSVSMDLSIITLVAISAMDFAVSNLITAVILWQDLNMVNGP